MCTIAILFQVIAGAPLVVAANRDEMFARPTRPPERLGTSRGVSFAGGVDELSGGTWLAVRGDGRFAAVTNQRAMAPVPSGLRSRGLAVRELAASDDPNAYVAALEPARYASMNLVWGSPRGVWVAYLRRPGDAGAGPAGERVILSLAPGIHVLCNDRIGAEGFPRGVRLADSLAAIVSSVVVPPALPAIVPALQVALADHTRVDAPDSHLPPELARELTATCIHSPAYGTRSSTIFAADGAAAVAYLHADGPPCVTAFLDRMELL